MATTVTPAPGTETHVVIGSDSNGSNKNQIFAVIGVLVCLCCLLYCCLSSSSSMASILSDERRRRQITTLIPLVNPLNTTIGAGFTYCNTSANCPAHIPYCDPTTGMCTQKPHLL